MQSCIHIYTGDGKGKTTSSVGLAVRCAGSGQKVLFTQFMKDNKSSELAILRTIPLIEFLPSPKYFGFSHKMTEEQKTEARQVYSDLLVQAAEKAVHESIRLLVLDEIISAYNLNLIDREYLLDFLKNRPVTLEVVLTGRDPAPELVELADYVSDIRKVKHPYDKGIVARKGIEK